MRFEPSKVKVLRLPLYAVSGFPNLRSLLSDDGLVVERSSLTRVSLARFHVVAQGFQQNQSDDGESVGVVFCATWYSSNYLWNFKVGDLVSVNNRMHALIGSGRLVACVLSTVCLLMVVRGCSCYVLVVTVELVVAFGS